MPKFGQYETDRLLYRTGFNAIYLWQPGGKGSRRCLVKAYRPSVRVRDEKLAAAQSEAFLDSAGVQQKVAREDARYWAPIHESGVSPDGAFYVTDTYDVSAQQLIDGRVNVGAASLYRLIESATRGLLALRRACGRPHGNLKFTNILIARRRLFTREKVVLSDPCPSSQLDADTHAKMDLRQLGALIHQLVTRRSLPLVAGYQAPDSPDWRRLGRHADTWRGLCNRLLTMDVEAQPITLEELAAQLSKVAPSRLSRLFRIIACVCVILLIAVLYRPVSGLVTGVLWPPDPEKAKRAYQQCCEAQSWLRPLWYKLAEKPPDIDKPRGVYWKSQDEVLKRLVQQIGKCGKPFEKVWETGPALAASPPEKLATSRGYQQDIIDANDARREIEALLFGGTGWALPKKLAEHATALHGARCGPMASYLNTLRDSIGPHEKLAERIDAVLYLNTNWYMVEYDKVVAEAVAADPTLTTPLQGVAPDPNRTAPAEVFATDPNLTDPMQSARDFVRRLHRLPEHYRQEIREIDDLRAAEERLRNALEDVIAKGDTEAQILRGELDQRVVPRLTQIESIPRTRANAPNVINQCKMVQDTIAAINLRIKNADQRYDEWRAQAQDPSGIGSSPALAAAYLKRLDNDKEIGPDRDAFIKAYQRQWGKLAELGGRVEQLRKNLLLLNDRLPRTIAPQSASAWAGEISTHYENTQRKNLITTITDNLAHLESFPDPTHYPDDCKKLLTWPEKAAALMKDFNDIERGLDYCYPLTEELPWAKKDMWSLYQNPDHRGILEEPPVGKSLAPVTDRLTALQRIQAQENVDSLFAAAQGALALEARVAAWRKLAALPLAEEKWQADEDLRVQLQTEFEKRRENRPGQMRWSELVQEVQHKGIERLAARVAVKARGSGAMLLERLEQLKPAAPAEMPQWLACLKSLWEKHVNSADWPGQYDLREFDKDHPSAQAKEAVIVTWLSEVSQYRRIKDEQDVLQWEDIRSELDRSIEEALKNAADDTDLRARLNDAKTKLQELDGDARVIKVLPPIEKYGDLRRRVREMEENISSLVHPAYKYLAFREGTAAFKNGLGLDRFEPVDLRFRPFDRAGFRDELFEMTDRRDRQNAGWPRFIRARKVQNADPNIVLGFVPGNTQTPPFYISQGEITNRQYVTFLVSQKRQARDFILGPLYSDHEYDSAIEGQRVLSQKENHPVVWITYQGAEAYASWLGAQLPEKSWHERAAAHNDPVRSHYGNPQFYHVRAKAWWDRVGEYNKKVDSITGPGCRPLGAADGVDSEGEGSTRIDQGAEPLPAARQEWNEIWPTASRAGGTPAGDSLSSLHLFDLIGNVWEWCKDDNPDPNAPVCGGSCLSDPIEYTKPDGVFYFSKARGACDVGFRVAVKPTLP